MPSSVFACVFALLVQGQGTATESAHTARLGVQALTSEQGERCALPPAPPPTTPIRAAAVNGASLLTMELSDSLHDVIS